MKRYLALLIFLAGSLLIFNETASFRSSQLEEQKQATAPIYLGGIFSLSGFGAVAGQGELNGTMMAIEEINKQNGIGGRPLKLIVEDNQSDLRQTASAFTKLLGMQQPAALLGPNWVEFAEIAAYLAEKERIVMLTASGYKKNSIEDNSFVFTTWPKHFLTTKPLTEYLAVKKHDKLAAIITENAYYSSVFDEMKEQLAEAGVSISEEMHFQPGVHDYRSAIAKLKRNGVDAVLVFLLENGETSSFLKQMKEMRFDAQAYGTYGLQFDTVLMKSLASAEGVIFFDIINTSSKEFIVKYRARFGEEPIASSALAYDNVYVIKQAIERCGLASNQLRRCLVSETFKGVTGRIEFDRQGNISGREKVSRLMEVKDGSFMPFNEMP